MNAVSVNKLIIYISIIYFLKKDINKKKIILKLQRTVAQSDETLQMIVGMKIKEALPHVPIFDRYINREYILVLSNRMQKMANNDYNFNDVNFRIMDANVNDLILNTRCENPNNDETPFKISIHL